MSVREQRQEVARLLIRELSSGDVVVSAPDHPLLIEGPDVVVGGEGGLLAIYIPKAKERRRPSHLKVRFILSRLALPPDSRHVLILRSPTEDSIGSQFAGDFATILQWNRRRDLADLARDRVFTGAQRELPAEVSSFARQRFADVFQMTRVFQDLRRRTEGTPTQDRLPEGQGRRRRASTGPVDRIAPDILFARFGRGAPATPSLYNLAQQTTSSAFALDSSVPYPTGRDDYGLALIDELPEYRGDPEKLMRAAAFAGWALVPEEQRQSLDAIVGRLARRRGMRL